MGGFSDSQGSSVLDSLDCFFDFLADFLVGDAGKVGETAVHFGFCRNCRRPVAAVQNTNIQIDGMGDVLISFGNP